MGKRRATNSGRLFFDPAKMQGSPPPAAPAAAAPVDSVPPTSALAGADTPLSVSQVAQLIDGALRRGTPQRLRVIGEISGFTDRTHWYFRLKDDQRAPGLAPAPASPAAGAAHTEAVLECVMFASAARAAGFVPASGLRVVLTGRIEFYARSGRTQFYAESMEPVGLGELDRRFKALCAELKALGWFDPARKRPLPTFPRRVAVLTSRTGAALQDVLVTMHRRCPSVEVALVDVRVQGESAAPEIAHALAWLSASHLALGIDAVLLTRGGGSMEDLWAFNDRALARAILECAVPVVAAIGHETDTTIAELVADERCATPTQAAVRLTPDRAALTEQLDQNSARLRGASLRRLGLARERLRGLVRAPALADPRSLLRAPRQRLDRAALRLGGTLAQGLSAHSATLARLAHRLALVRPEALFAARAARVHAGHDRLRRAIDARLRRVDLDQRRSALGAALRGALDRRADRLDALERELVVAGPASVLARGYSVTTDEGGHVVRSVAQAGSGQTLLTRVLDGSIRSVVLGADAPGRSDLPSPGVHGLGGSIAPPRPGARSRRARADAPRHQMDLFAAPG